ncbi:MAG: hypothetical protein K8R68_06345 [Bacteroidales bacterium]|nr:hypothetical protein [Bacteroidales bacterium]
MKTKRERFEIIASNRVQKTIGILDSLGKCSNRNNYDYTESDIRKMEKVLRDKLNEVLTMFNSGLKKGQKTDFKF